MKETISRLRIPLVAPIGERFVFTTVSNQIIASGYSRVVIGDRGAYIEFLESHINTYQIFIPDNESYRLLEKYKDKVYYIEYRTIEDNVKVYLQTKTVDYADYRIGRYYISPIYLNVTHLAMQPKKRKVRVNYGQLKRTE